jgi:bis(5'-adenosyl)-triphosphatase
VSGALPHCPFCPPAVEPAAFFADERFMALYNVAPVLPGHALIVPRRHVASLLELADDELAAFVLFARRITRFLHRAFTADGFDWTVQDGASAGQTVLHLHLHVIPRVSGDLPDPGDWYPALIASDTAQAAALGEIANGQIDSRARPRLTPAEHAQVTAYLRALIGDAGS